MVRKLLLPQMTSEQHSGHEAEVDLALFVPVVKILLTFKDLHEDDETGLTSCLSKMLVTLSVRLKSRRWEDRKGARDVLCEVAALLGPDYFPAILSNLEGSLQRGYQVHVLLFTVNAVMDAMAPRHFRSCFDGSVERLLDLVGNELFGSNTRSAAISRKGAQTMAEEKKVKAIVGKTPEAAKTVSYPLLEKLGLLVSKNYVLDILGLLIGGASSSGLLTFEGLQKLRRAIKSFQQGLMKNSKASGKGDAGDGLGREDFLALASGLLSGKVAVEHGLENNRKSVRNLLREMAFGILCSVASSDDGTAALGLEELAEFLDPVTENLDNKDVDVVSVCLKFLTIVTQTRMACDWLLSSSVQKSTEVLDSKDLMFLVTKKCRFFQPMKNRTPYNYCCQILRNLLTHNTSYRFKSGEELKKVCAFFQMCLESSDYDDANAVRLLGLLLFKYYSHEAHGSFLRLVCVASLKARNESTFNLAKNIVLKIVRKHSALNLAMNFYSQHINYELFEGINCCVNSHIYLKFSNI